MTYDAADTLLALSLALTAQRYEPEKSDPSIEAELTEQALETGRIQPDTLERLLRGHNPDALRANAYTIVVALDDAFSFIVQRKDPRALIGPFRRWATTGVLSALPPDESGALLPLVTPPRQTESESGIELTSVVAVSPEAYRCVRHTTLFGRQHQVGTPIAGGRPRLAVAGAPLVQNPDELKWSLEGGRCRVRAKDKLAERIPRILEALDNSEAEIAVLPELTLTPELLDRWLDALRRRPSSGGRLQWILVGSGPVGGGAEGEDCNRAVLLEWTARSLPRYFAKRTRFHLERTDVENHGLPRALRSDGAEEANDCDDDRVGVIETYLGRVAVVVSDDLFDVPADLLVEWGVSLILSPTLLSSQVRDRESDAAEECADRIGTCAAVASTIIADRTDQGQPAFAGLVRKPGAVEKRLATCDGVWTEVLPLRRD